MFDKICEDCVDEAVKMINVKETKGEERNRRRLNELLKKYKNRDEIEFEIDAAREYAINRGFKVGMRYAVLIAMEIAQNKMYKKV